MISVHKCVDDFEIVHKHVQFGSGALRLKFKQGRMHRHIYGIILKNANLSSLLIRIPCKKGLLVNSLLTILIIFFFLIVIIYLLRYFA